MNGHLSLDGAWKIRWCDDNHGRPEHYVGVEADETLFYDATVPGYRVTILDVRTSTGGFRHL